MRNIWRLLVDKHFEIYSLKNCGRNKKVISILVNVIIFIYFFYFPTTTKLDLNVFEGIT